jgi:hypothetical protein
MSGFGGGRQGQSAHQQRGDHRGAERSSHRDTSGNLMSAGKQSAFHEDNRSRAGT